MKFILTIQMLFALAISDIIDIKSFEADFSQVISDENNKKLHYSGSIKALKPQYALWKYKKPIEKSIYMSPENITIIEPEIEQVIIRNISSDFDFFQMIKKAKMISTDTYITYLKEVKYTIIVEKNLIQSISYKDEFGNKIIISFKNQLQNKKIFKKIFKPSIPKDYDIISIPLYTNNT